SSMKAPKKILLTAALSLSVAACERIPADNKLGKIIEQTQDTTVALLQTNDSVIQQRDQQTELEQTKKTIDSIEAQEERNIYTIIKSGVIIDRVTQKTFPLPAGIHIPYKYVDQTNSTPEHIRIRTENFAGSIDSSLLAPYK
ncbi:hypothetical protein KBC03_03680, partial [Patescibacteria group bacterium]|nr:hypothetical protein [Patescibacteria group bacterium]